jgi:DNA (cytosine-5)-methyltransferase 1
MKYVSLFAGIGGFDLALNRLGHVCVWANEWDKYAAEIYNKNFGSEEGGKSIQGTERRSIQSNRDKSDTTSRNNKQPETWGNREFQQSKDIDTRDIRTVPTSEIPDHDLLVGGFPCQAFSIAGKRRGFDDTRGTLFFEIARILKDKNPKYFILENVKGLLSHDNGSTFKTIISTLDGLGYDLQWQVLNSKNFGVPQNRERVFIVGHIRGQPRPEVFPIGTSDKEVGKSIKILAHKDVYRRANQVYDAGGSVETLSTCGGGGQHPCVAIPEATKKGYAEASVGQAINLAVPNSKTRRGRVSDIAQTVDTGMQQHTLTPEMRIRRLTPTECERLQGFPDGWTEGVSDTQRYKCLGNAVTVNVVYEVAKRLQTKGDKE